ncbi:hypothetical protein LTR72_011298 [Exophiala xenobiotica]|nr:hypothetical protein LTR72_011298 [Exophiala xenobiotica]KAK5285038.1 hypothetical protein LTR14_011278 [Exophiala xenobiotica]KAK5469166.1 hypothetical protein LTR55_011289 [Exophiala xenobiotica]
MPRGLRDVLEKLKDRTTTDMDADLKSSTDSVEVDISELDPEHNRVNQTIVTFPEFSVVPCFTMLSLAVQLPVFAKKSDRTIEQILEDKMQYDTSFR